MSGGSSRLAGTAGLLLLAILWGTMVPTITHLLKTWDPLFLAALRYLGGGPALLPALWLARRRSSEGMADVEAELDLPPLVNGFGYAASRIEALLIRAGVDLPAGGSLLAIARKPPADPA